MRKIALFVSVFLTVLLVCTGTVMCFVCLAEDASEYTFQGVPWYASPNDVITKLLDAGFVDLNKFPSLQEAQNDGSPYFSHIGEYKKDKKVPYRFVYKKKDTVAINLLCQTVWSDQLCVTIAKQEIRNISFLYTPDSDCPRLVEVCIWFDDTDSDYDMEAVYSSLADAYGTPSSCRKNEFVWLGENNTIIVMYKNDVVFASLDGLTNSVTTMPEEKKDSGF